MNLARLYAKNNSLQQENTSYVLDNYLHLMQWKKRGGDVIMDIGCGTGNALVDLILPSFPQNFHKVVGIDISEKMVEYSRSKYQTSKIFFELMDIATKDLPIKFIETFDHIVSFFCLQWVQDHRQALSNIMEMLKPEGDILLTFLAGAPAYDVYETLSKSKEWKSYMKDYKSCFGRYHNSKNPSNEYKTLLEEIGFKIGVCTIEDTVFIYEDEVAFKRAMTAVNFFLHRIPENQKDDYMNDFVNEYKKLPVIENNSNGCIIFPYKMFIIQASKPT